MNDVEILRTGVEVAAIKLAEAQRICDAAAEVKKVINKIPKGKAGSGKGAKRVANRNHMDAQKAVNQKTTDLENARRKFENAEQALRGISLTQTTMIGGDSSFPLGTLRENASDTPLRSPCNSDENNDLGAGMNVESLEPQTNVASESCHSGMISHMHREELPCQQPVSEGDSFSGEPSDGSEEQSDVDSNAGDNVKGQEHNVNAVSESRVFRLIPRDRRQLSEKLTHYQTVSNRNPSPDEPLDGFKEQGNGLEKEAGVERHCGSQVASNAVALELDVTGQVLPTTATPPQDHRGHQSHETSSNQPPQGSAKPFDNSGDLNYTEKRPEVEDEYEKGLLVSGAQGGFEEQDAETMNYPEKKHGRVTAGRVSRSKKKLESAGKSTEAQAAESLRPITDEVEDGDWVVFLSDPTSDTDEEEADRVSKFKHLPLTAQEKEMYRYMKMDEKKEYDKMARIAINLFLQENKEIDFGIRRMARLDPEFLPEAATTSRKLALHFLTSREGNIMCGYHSFKNKSSFVRDGWGKLGMKLKRMPARRKLGNSEQQRRPYIASCGCMIQDVLLEFALSKQISISGLVDGDLQIEKMTFHDYMEPRIRSFAFQAILLMVPDLSLNDFYTQGDVLNHTIGVAKKRAHYWKTAIEKFQAAASLEDDKEHELNSTELGGSKV